MAVTVCLLISLLQVWVFLDLFSCKSYFDSLWSLVHASNHFCPCQGYSGTYTFYVDASTGRPVAFHAQGHNVVVGGSHTDDYWLEYLDVRVFE